MWWIFAFGIWTTELEDRLDRLEYQQGQIAHAQRMAEHRQMLYALWGIKMGPRVTPLPIRSGPRDTATELGDWDR